MKKRRSRIEIKACVHSIRFHATVLRFNAFILIARFDDVDDDGDDDGNGGGGDNDNDVCVCTINAKCVEFSFLSSQLEN